MTTHKGTCFCGAVELEVSGAPKPWDIAIAGRAGRGRQDP